MEKRESSKTITIKINGKHQAFDDQNQKPKRRQGQIIDKAVTEATMEDSSKNNEEIHSINETAVGDEQKEDQFDWILPEPSAEPNLEEKKNVKEPKKSKLKTSKKWGNMKINKGIFATIFFAVFLAVLLGTSFGFTMLKLVFIEKPSETDVVVQEATTIPKQNQEQPQSGTLSVTLPAISSWVVQEGAYSNKNSAKTVESSLKEKEIAAAIFESDKAYILVGVADNKDHAKEIGSTLKASGIKEPFAKEISISGKEVSGLNQEEKTFLEGLPLLFNTLSSAVSTQPIPKDVMDSIEEQSKKLGDGKKINHEGIKSLKEHSDAAIKNIHSLQKAQDKKEATALQQHLLSMLATYQSLK